MERRKRGRGPGSSRSRGPAVVSSNLRAGPTKLIRGLRRKDKHSRAYSREYARGRGIRVHMRAAERFPMCPAKMFSPRRPPSSRTPSLFNCSPLAPLHPRSLPPSSTRSGASGNDPRRLRREQRLHAFRRVIVISLSNYTVETRAVNIPVWCPRATDPRGPALNSDTVEPPSEKSIIVPAIGGFNDISNSTEI